MIAVTVTIEATLEDTIIISITNEYLEDGTRVESIIEDIKPPNTNMTVFSQQSKTGRKTVNKYNGNSLLWSITVIGSFTYGNGTSRAIISSVSTSTYNSSWVIDNVRAWVSGNTAYGSARGRRFFGPLPINTVMGEVALTCSPTGLLS